MLTVSFFYAVELTKEIIVANFPVGTGSSRTDLSFGVSSMYDNSSKTQYIAGDYVYITLSENPINGSSVYKESSVITVNSGGTWYKQDFASGCTGSIPVSSPYEFNGTLPISVSTADVTGNWSVNGTYKERLDIQVDGETGGLTGFAYASVNASAFLIDLGQGEGFLLGLKRPAVAKSLTDIAGSYKFIDFWGDGDTGAGTILSLHRQRELITTSQLTDQLHRVHSQIFRGVKFYGMSGKPIWILPTLSFIWS